MSSRVISAFQVSMPLNLASRARSTQAPIRIASAACCFAALAGPFVTFPSITRSAAKTVGFGASHGGPNTGLFRQGVATFAMSSNVKANPFGNGDGIVIPAPSGTADSVLIFMHGLGDTASGWASAFPLPGMPNTKYVLPTAQTQRVTLNGGIPMPSWFDLYGLDDTAKDDVEGIKRAVERITRIIESEIANGVPTARIVVGGFSQGGAVALSTAFGFERKLAGVLGMSTWLPNAVRKGEVSAALRETPVLMCHGDRDATVPLKWAKISVEALRELSVQCELKTYANMAHSTSTEELADVRRFVKECLP